MTTFYFSFVVSASGRKLRTQSGSWTPPNTLSPRGRGGSRRPGRPDPPQPLRRKGFPRRLSLHHGSRETSKLRYVGLKSFLPTYLTSLGVDGRSPTSRAQLVFPVLSLVRDVSEPRDDTGNGPSRPDRVRVRRLLVDDRPGRAGSGGHKSKGLNKRPISLLQGYWSHHNYTSTVSTHEYPHQTP